MKILLIAGHGGTPYDSGAVGCGYTEAVETRRMANAVAPLLRSYGFEVALYDQSRDAYKVQNGMTMQCFLILDMVLLLALVDLLPSPIFFPLFSPIAIPSSSAFFTPLS